MVQSSKGKTARRGWAYENDYPCRVIIDQLISDGKNKEILVYKYYCFKVDPVFCQVIGYSTARDAICFYDMEWYHMEFRGINAISGNAYSKVPKPNNFEGLKNLARKLSSGSPHVRVDLNNVNGKIYFGELTFYGGSGYMSFTPDAFDTEPGQKWKSITQI